MRTLKQIPRCPLFFTIFVCCFSITVNAQNLVPNGSFEEAITCPTSVANLTNECFAWYSSLLFPDGAETTSDWFHECSEESLLTPPVVAFGTQEPFDGDGYAGLVAFSLVSENIREFIGVELLEPLTVGSVYLVEFKVSNFYFPDFVVTSNRLGFNFSTHPYYNLGSFPLDTSHYYESEIIPITGQWHTISHLFTADSAYQYFHIGNFYDDDNTDYIADSPSPDLSYYAIDDVSVSGVLSDGVFQYNKPNIKVFPNPSSGLFNIANNSPKQIKEFTVVDMTGRVVQPAAAFRYPSASLGADTPENVGALNVTDSKEIEIDIDGPAGLYLLRLELEDGSIEAYRIEVVK